MRAELAGRAGFMMLGDDGLAIPNDRLDLFVALVKETERRPISE